MSIFWRRDEQKIDKLSEENTELDGWRRWGEMDGDGGERWMGMRKGNKVAYFFVSGL